MSSIQGTRSTNGFLTRLEKEAEISLRDKVRSAYLAASQSVFGLSGKIDRIIFPVDAIVSVEFSADDSSKSELTTIGREGFAGVSLVSGIDFLHGRCIVRQAGSVLEMDLDTFSSIIHGYPKMKRLCDRYILYRLLSTSQQAACRDSHTVLQRVCQKLLIWEYRNGDCGQFDLTHQRLADMVGINRSTASEHASRLQSLGLIRYCHGKVTICDAAELSKKSCGCFETAQKLYQRLIDNNSQPEEQTH